MQIVILCGGLGTRLQPITSFTPKPMVKIQGKPFLEYLVAYLKNQTFKNFVFCVGYKGKSIQNYFQNGSKKGVDIIYSFEKPLLGTGGALKLAEPLLEKEFIVINGDTFLQIDYKKFIECCQKNSKTKAAIVYYQSSKKLSKIENNNLFVAKNNLIKKYEKNSATNKHLNALDAGIYLLKKDVIKKVKPNEKINLEPLLIPYMSKGLVIGFKTNTPPLDIGTPERLKIFQKAVNNDYFANSF